jgi:hypothetical protein
MASTGPRSLTTNPLIRLDIRVIPARLNDPDAPRTTLDDIVTQRPGHADYDAYDAAALRYFGLMLNLGRYVDHPRQLPVDLDEPQVNLGPPTATGEKPHAERRPKTTHPGTPPLAIGMLSARQGSSQSQ